MKLLKTMIPGAILNHYKNNCLVIVTVKNSVVQGLNNLMTVVQHYNLILTSTKMTQLLMPNFSHWVKEDGLTSQIRMKHSK